LSNPERRVTVRRTHRSKARMEIEIWSDLICPFCGLGNQRLDNALRRFAHADKVTIIHRSFELNPAAPVGEVHTVREMLQEKYGMSDAQVQGQHARIKADAAAEGLVPYEVTDNRVGSTALAHELLAYASEQGREAEAWHHLYRAYFGETRSIFTVDSLVELAVEIGLDADSTREVLTDRRYRDRVHAEQRVAQELGATGVPFIVIDRRYGIAGAQPLDTMLATIEKAWDESRPALVTVGEGAECGPDGCAVPEGDAPLL
jgi:predicted DsbA family dithiol-disulfide isomerase